MKWIAQMTFRFDHRPFLYNTRLYSLALPASLRAKKVGYVRDCEFYFNLNMLSLSGYYIHIVKGKSLEIVDPITLYRRVINKAVNTWLTGPWN